MILYNWKKIFKAAEGNAVDCWRIFKMLAGSEIPKNKYDKIYYYSNMNFLGKSFILHEDVLIYNSYKYCTRDLCVYLALASLRSLAEYKVSGKLTLDVIHDTSDLGETINDPSLLYVKDGQIHFPYEESSLKRK